MRVIEPVTDPFICEFYQTSLVPKVHCLKQVAFWYSLCYNENNLAKNTRTLKFCWDSKQLLVDTLDFTAVFLRKNFGAEDWFFRNYVFGSSGCEMQELFGLECRKHGLNWESGRLPLGSSDLWGEFSRWRTLATEYPKFSWNYVYVCIP